MRKLLLLVPLLLVAAGCGGGEDSSSSGHSADDLKDDGYVVIPRTNMAVKPPKGFEVNDAPGIAAANVDVYFQQEGASQPDSKKAAEEFEAKFLDPDAFGGGTATIGEVDHLKIDGRAAFAATGTREDEKGVQYKLVIVGMLTEGLEVSAVATLYPDATVTPEQMLDTVKNLRWAKERGKGELPFTITPATNYKAAPSSARLVLTPDGRRGAGVSEYVVSSGLLDEPVEPRDRLEFAKQYVRGDLNKPKEIEVDGLPGYEFEVPGDDFTRAAYGAMLFTADGYILVDALARQGDDQRSAFQEMTRSLKLPSGKLSG